VNQAAPDLVGRTVLGRYRVVRAIGRGGMGVIYLARTEGAAGFVKPFVIKQAAPEAAQGDTMIAQLAREARIMSNLRHPGIVSVIDFAAEGRSHLLVLDYVQGYNLGQWRKFVQHSGRDFPAELAIHVVERVLDALDYAHRLARSDGAPLGIVHRDVSPANVLLDVDGHVKLADFGVARMSADHTEVSDGPMIKGKISYMAPELLEQIAPTPGSDVYACAVVLHELLVGRNEFKADTAPMTAIRVMQHVPSYVSALRSDVPGELDAVLQRALAKSPKERFASARELADELNRVRTVPREQSARLLASTVREDFNDPRMAEMLGSDDLSTLDRAWRDVSAGSEGSATSTALDPQIPVHVEAAAGPAAPSIPTVAAAPVALATKRTSAAPWPIILGVAGLLAGAGALALVLRSRASQEGPERVIVVDSRAGGASGAPVVEPLVGAPGVAASEPAPVAASATAPPVLIKSGDNGVREGNVPREGSAEALSRVMARRQDAIGKCFAAGAADVSGTPGLAVHFEVDASGHVVSARVLPQALATTPLGQCIEGVARGADFGPQPRPLSFRIPITAHRAP
jgi:eukaryotic-like serine/threonine-protein kinase